MSIKGYCSFLTILFSFLTFSQQAFSCEQAKTVEGVIGLYQKQFKSTPDKDYITIDENGFSYFGDCHERYTVDKDTCEIKLVHRGSC